MACAAWSGVGCRSRSAQPAASQKQTVAWRRLGAWSGRGNKQTESFTSDTGTLRIHWETTGAGGPGGAFRLTAHSAISGRPLQQVVDHRGTGSGLGYVQQDPHIFYLVVESDQLAWSIVVEEAMMYP